MTSQTRRSLHGIPDDLWRRAKSQAAAKGISLSEWIKEAMEEKLEKGRGKE